MRIAGYKTLAIAMFVAASVTGASAQVSNGTFTPPATSVGAGWGTSSSFPAPGFGPNATVNWALGSQYAYDPVTANFNWIFNGGAGVQQNGSAWGFTAPPVGSQSAFLQDYNGTYCYNGGCVPVGNSGSPSSISQTLTGLTQGTQYDLSFYMEERSYNIGGYAPVVVTVGTASTPQLAPNSTYVWQAYNVLFYASGPSESLSFSSPFPSDLAYGSDLDTGIADVSITSLGGGPSPSGPTYSLPEGGAASLYMLLAGAACFGAVLFRPRNTFASRAQA